MLRLRLLFLRDAQRQHTILIVGLDRFRIHRAREREAASEGAIGALYAQIVLLTHILLELALAANRQDVVLHTDVQILGIDVRQISLHHQFMLGLVDVNRGCPGSEAGFVARALKDVIEQPIHLVLQGSSPAEWFPSSKCSHIVSTSKSDYMRIIKYECAVVKSKVAVILDTIKSLQCISLQPVKFDRKLSPAWLRTDGNSGIEEQSACFVCLRRFPVRLPFPMHLDELNYHLPREQIAQRPLDRREASRLLLLDRSTGVFEDRLFAEFPSLLRGDELLVFNNARVIPARLFGKRAGVHSQPPSRATRSDHLTGIVEIFITRALDSQTCASHVCTGH